MRIKIEFLKLAGCSDEVLLTAMISADNESLARRRASQAKYMKKKKLADKNDINDIISITKERGSHTLPKEYKNNIITSQGNRGVNQGGKGEGKKGTRLPADWNPSNAIWGWAQVKLGMGMEQLKFETNAFKDHFWSSARANATKLNWDKTWQNWMREAYRRGHRKGNGSDKLQAVRDACNELREKYGRNAYAADRQS